MVWTLSLTDEPYVDLRHYALIGSTSINPFYYCLVLGIVILMMPPGAVKTKIPLRREALDGMKLNVL